jgi:hypothetical protein
MASTWPDHSTRLRWARRRSGVPGERCAPAAGFDLALAMGLILSISAASFAK